MSYLVVINSQRLINITKITQGIRVDIFLYCKYLKAQFTQKILQKTTSFRQDKIGKDHESA